ncbi:unnamed protein product [Linum tenue]|uniref:Uncharacterized protein n=1 Tax=Linum tenue TaxID=586396 RepID=A0AAV0LJL5_9ROSI|nr:unnamed protein product [Linum tenue]
MAELGLLLLCTWPQSSSTLLLRFLSLLGMQART